MERLHINPNIFFFIHENEIVLWDYKHHTQYALQKEYFERILAWKNPTFKATLSEIDKELIEADVLSLKPYPNVFWGWDKLSYIFHLGTNDINYVDGGLEEQQWITLYLQESEKLKGPKPQLFVERSGLETLLPKPTLEKLSDSSFLETLKNRKTSREFLDQSISLTDLSTLLFVSFGLIHGPWQELKELGLDEYAFRKTSPSGGGLHPTEVFLVVNNIEELSPGVYHYNVKKHALTRINDQVSDEQLTKALAGQFFGKSSACGIFLVSFFEKIWRKYPHSRAYRIAVLDAGHISQTCLLTATALNIQTWITGAFYEQQVNEFLKLDGIHQAPFIYIALGHGSGASIPEKIKQFIK